MPSHPHLAALLRELRAQENPDNVAGMARYGIQSANALGISAPWLRARAKALGRDHELALALWETNIFEARALAGLVDEPSKVTRTQMERWASGFDSWAVCDGICCNLFDRTPFAWEKAYAWAERREEFVKRAGFVLVAGLATHDKKCPDETFVAFLPVIVTHAVDPRPMVKKGVNWALRHIGKRNLALNRVAVPIARQLAESKDASARWVGRDALRELTNEKILARVAKKRV